MKLIQYPLILLLSCESLHAALRTNGFPPVPEYNALIDWRTAYRVAQEKEEKKRAFFKYVYKKRLWKIFKENIDKPLDEVLEYFKDNNLFLARHIMLLLAARHGYIPAIKILLQYGVDINKNLHPKEYTPLGYAIKKQHWKVIKFLLDNGANPNRSCGPDSPNALHAAAKWGNKAAVLLFLKNNCHVDKNRFPWDSPLAAAIKEGHSDIVKILLHHGAKVHKYEIVTAKVHKRDDILPILMQQFQYQQASTCTLL